MLHLLNHPLINHKLSIMRQKNTSTKDFRQLLNEIAGLMAYEITRSLPTKEIDIETPIEKTKGVAIAKDIVLVPILRAGLGMTEGITNLIPTAKVGHVGLYRNEETLEPVYYYAKFPDETKNASVFVVDPMLATGGSACAAIDRVKQTGATDIKLICLVGVQDGVDAVSKAHPDVDIYLASLDNHLNEHGYICPGLGDAGDRIFGTK